MKTYLLRILYCGSDRGLNYMFHSNKTNILDLLVDFHKEKYDEKISTKIAYSLYVRGEDVIELLVDMDDKKILITN